MYWRKSKAQQIIEANNPKKPNITWTASEKELAKFYGNLTTKSDLYEQILRHIKLGIKKPQCLICGEPLEVRKFVDAYNADDTPSQADINEDLYCTKCDVRWHCEIGPHDFYVEKETH